MSAPDTQLPIDKDRIKSLMVRSDTAGLIKLFQHILAITLAVFLLAISNHWALQLIFTFLLGTLLVFFFAPEHECIHKTAFDSPKLNYVVAWICGLIIFLPPKCFQAFHMAHHRYTQIESKDPELDTKKPETLAQYLWLLTGVDYWIEQVKSIVLFAIGIRSARYISDVKYPEVVKEARIFLGIYLGIILLSIFSGSGVALKFWIFPILLGQPMLRAFLLAEHVLCPKVADMLKNTRTTLTNRIVRWLCWDMSFHVEHHAYPAIPFHQLQDTHTLLAPHISIISSGYLNVQKDVVRSL